MGNVFSDSKPKLQVICPWAENCVNGDNNNHEGSSTQNQDDVNTESKTE